MKSLPVFIFLGFAAATYSCKAPDAPAKKVVEKNKSLVIGNPVDCGIDNFLIFPVGSNYNPTVYGDVKLKDGENQYADYETTELNITVNGTGRLNDKGASTEYINGNENEFDIRNILFYDQNSGQTYPLIKDTVHILSFALHKEFINPLIFYRIVKKDINKDSVFNSKDPVILFVSDIHGRNLIQVTPDDQQFADYFYYPATNIILIKSAIDANKDHHFNSGDETNFTEMNIKTPAMGREIFTKSLKDSLRLQ